LGGGVGRSIRTTTTTTTTTTATTTTTTPTDNGNFVGRMQVDPILVSLVGDDTSVVIVEVRSGNPGGDGSSCVQFGLDCGGVWTAVDSVFGYGCVGERVYLTTPSTFVRIGTRTTRINR